MDVLIILLLILLAIFLVVVETLLLPGITVAAIGAFAAGIYAFYLSYSLYGFGIGITVFLLILLLSLVAVLICVKKRSISKMSLKVNSDSVVPNVRELVKPGECGVASTRLAPMGTVLVENHYVEAKSVGGFIDQKTAVKIIGYEDNIILVEKI